MQSRHSTEAPIKTASHPPPPDLIEGEEEFEVKRIVAHRMFGQSKHLQYLIKWKGYPESDNTWEPADQVHAPDLIKLYQSTAKHQSAIRVMPYQSAGREQSMTKAKGLKGARSTLQKHIECPTIFPASLLNASLKIFLSKSLPLSNARNTTLTLLNPAPLVSSASAISLIQNTSPTTTGIASSAIAHFTTPTEACPTPQSMP